MPDGEIFIFLSEFLSPTTFFIYITIERYLLGPKLKFSGQLTAEPSLLTKPRVRIKSEIIYFLLNRKYWDALRLTFLTNLRLLTFLALPQITADLPFDYDDTSRRD